MGLGIRTTDTMTPILLSRNKPETLLFCLRESRSSRCHPSQAQPTFSLSQLEEVLVSTFKPQTFISFTFVPFAFYRIIQDVFNFMID